MKNNTDKPLILAVETSGRAGSIALGTGDDILSEITFSASMRHNAELFPAISDVLSQLGRKPAQIGHIYVSTGPGSFTGIRIAVTMAKMVAMTNGAKIAAVNTTDALVRNADDYISAKGEIVERVATIIDAKRRQFFVALFEKTPTGWIKTLDDRILKAADLLELLPNDGKATYLTGEGLLYYKDSFTADKTIVIDSQYWPAKARHVYAAGHQIAQKGLFTPAGELLPSYLRRPEAEENWEKKQDLTA
ncbi:MAG: tRNA (adenosine(37)-N6)-threonylcarbamoyltransferase complex dimerization subunit type 1 TsaB [Anaerohalosphaera sp.]|nr:tRNA (adenosine(37)-N6)-threonylcarbamoyltransferase complex dimerization subunit type 1 TsaB [Anaerohalosphaera sp.]